MVRDVEKAAFVSADARDCCRKNGGMGLSVLQRKTATAYHISATWYSNSPPILNFLREYLAGDGNNIRVIVYDDFRESLNTVDLMAQKLSREPVLKDSFTVSHGGKYLVWAFE